MTGKKVCVLPGDGIGPEVIDAALSVLCGVAMAAGIDISTTKAAIGGEALALHGNPLPEETLELCLSSDAILLGAVGHPAWDRQPPHLRPEKGLLELRKRLGAYGNLRPVRQLRGLLPCSPLKSEIAESVDLMVVRELTGGLYFGEPRGQTGPAGSEAAVNTMRYHRCEIERIARLAFEVARKRRRRVTSVDKANVLEVSQLWRSIVEEVRPAYPEVELAHQYVDNCAMQFVLNPAQFDVVLTENMFGDILSDIGGALTGSLGTLPSASVGEGPALYEPVHGSAPDIAGRDAANPMGAIGCVSMMFDLSFARPDLGAAIDKSVEWVLERGYRTRDLARGGGEVIGTSEFAARIVQRVTCCLNGNAGHS